MLVGRPRSTHELVSSERLFLSAMSGLRFGRFEGISVVRGQVVLDPWPRTIRRVKFGAANPAGPRSVPRDFELKVQVAEFFELVRALGNGMIRVLEVHDGLPFTLDFEEGPDTPGERQRV